MFQFTHPGKGATRSESSRETHATVSIHAPWEGCDGRFSRSSVLTAVFQFTHPGKGATSDERQDQPEQ